MVAKPISRINAAKPEGGGVRGAGALMAQG
jgi:hypothetical protein